MTSGTKLNGTQKNVLAEYMREHPNLAKNLLPNCAQGRATSKRLWEELSKKLNVAGPPVKDVKSWKKVFADQKHQAKKKLSFNKASKNRTGGGPYEEKFLTQADEHIIEASGLEAAVDGLVSVKTFGDAQNKQRSSTPLPENSDDSFCSLVERVVASENDENSNEENEERFEENKTKPRMNKTNLDPKMLLLKENIKSGAEFNKKLESKIDRLLDIQERFLEIQEERHKSFLALNQIELQIKALQLDILKTSN